MAHRDNIQLLGWKAWNLPEAMLSEHPEINWRLLITVGYWPRRNSPSRENTPQGVVGYHSRDRTQTPTHYREHARLTHKF